MHNVRLALTLLHIFDPLSKTRLLIDTDAEVSFVPATASQRSLPPALHLYAANGITIPVFSLKTMLVELSLCSFFEWTIYVAAVFQAIVGAVFLQHFGLLMDVQNWQLVDSLTLLATHMQPSPSASACLSFIKSETQFAPQSNL